jgi:hypothetical protein
VPLEKHQKVKVRFRVLAGVGVLLGLLGVSGALAAQEGQVRLAITIAGHGGVRLSNGRHFRCSTTSCKRTVLVRSGSRITLKATPARSWVFSAWSGACRSTKPTCSLRVRRGSRVTEKFLPPGSTSANPIPFGHSFAFGDGWSFAVRSVTMDATAQIVAIPGNAPPPPGAQYTMLNVTATYAGRGHSSFDDSHGLGVIGAQNVAYGSCSQQLPPPTFDPYRDVYSGTIISGNVCFQIASNDADSLLFFSDSYNSRTWFALR